MKDSSDLHDRRGSFIVTVFFLVAGVIAFYDTLSYSDSDSRVFPQTVSLALILFSCISLLAQFLKPQSSEGFGEGIWWRRVLLVASMLLACALMPLLGFLPAGTIAFLGGLIAAMHDRWSLKTGLIYGGSGLVIMTAFFSLFKYALHVPLP